METFINNIWDKETPISMKKFGNQYKEWVLQNKEERGPLITLSNPLVEKTLNKHMCTFNKKNYTIEKIK